MFFFLWVFCNNFCVHDKRIYISFVIIIVINLYSAVSRRYEYVFNELLITINT